MELLIAGTLVVIKTSDKKKKKFVEYSNRKSMIKFFQRIRRKLISEGNSKRYLTYALGEIFLVMIGILLALQVNNWNEERKQRNLETQYLEQLTIDLANDTVYYNDKFSMYSGAYASVRKFIQEIYKTQESREEIKKLLGYLDLSTDPLRTHNPTYLELTSTGNLGIIEPPALKSSISNYYRLNEQFASQIEEFNATSNQLAVEALIIASGTLKYVVQLGDDPSAYNDNEWKYFNEPSSKEFQSLETLALIVQNRNNEFLNYFDQLNRNAKDLISKINEKLDNKK
jgi:hypothetical protein